MSLEQKLCYSELKKKLAEDWILTPKLPGAGANWEMFPGKLLVFGLVLLFCGQV